MSRRDVVILRDRWYNADSDFGVKLTNRAGTIETGNQISKNKFSKCFYTAYQFLVDWNGDVFLCPQDWQRRVTMGNMMQENIFNIWKGKMMSKYEKNLFKEKEIVLLVTNVMQRVQCLEKIMQKLGKIIIRFNNF